MLTSPHLSGCIFQSLSICYLTASLFYTPRGMVMKVVTPSYGWRSKSLSCLLFGYIRDTARRERIGVENLRIMFLTTRDLQQGAAAGSKTSSSVLTKAVESWPSGCPFCICACGVRVDELRKYGSHFSTQDNARLPWGCLFPGHLFTVSFWPDTNSRTVPRRQKLMGAGIRLTPHWPHHLNRKIIFRIILKAQN